MLGFTIATVCNSLSPFCVIVSLSISAPPVEDITPLASTIILVPSGFTKPAVEVVAIDGCDTVAQVPSPRRNLVLSVAVGAGIIPAVPALVPSAPVIVFKRALGIKPLFPKSL